MKKLSAIVASAVTYFSMAPYALAGGINVGGFDICADERFDPLCGPASGDIGGIINAILTILFIVAVLIALLFLIWGGIKWILSGGDKAKVEAARGTIVAALVGLVLVFLSYFIINLVFQFFGLPSIADDRNFEIPSIGF